MSNTINHHMNANDRHYVDDLYENIGGKCRVVECDNVTLLL
jgi:hypothetical protein